MAAFVALCIHFSRGRFIFYCDIRKCEYLMEKIMHWSAGFTSNHCVVFVGLPALVFVGTCYSVNI